MLLEAAYLESVVSRTAWRGRCNGLSSGVSVVVRSVCNVVVLGARKNRRVRIADLNAGEKPAAGTKDLSNANTGGVKTDPKASERRYGKQANIRLVNEGQKDSQRWSSQLSWQAGARRSRITKGDAE